MSSPRLTRAAVLIGGLLLSAAAWAQTPPADDAPANARVRIFGANGQGITMYRNAACRDETADKVEVARSTARAVGSAFIGAPGNVSIGMPETDSVRTMKSEQMSKPNYQEYAVEGGQPLFFSARMEGNNGYRCLGDMNLQFVASPGHDYEVAMRMSNGQCKLSAREVLANGALEPLQAVARTPSCTAATAQDEPVDLDAAALAAPASGPLRDWKRTVWISTGLSRSPDGVLLEADTLRVVTRGDTGKRVAGTVGLVALSSLSGAHVQGFSKKDLRGTYVPTLKSPAEGLIPTKLRERLTAYFTHYPDAVPYDRQHVQVNPGQWSLTYLKLSDGDTPYMLEHRASISFINGEGRPSSTIQCNDEPRTNTLAAWQENDYALVKAAAEEVAELCAAHYADKLPDLFPELAEPDAATAAEPPAAPEQV